jgi:hypothetical protein
MVRTLIRSGSFAVAVVLAIQLTTNSLQAQLQRVSTAAASHVQQKVIQKTPALKDADVGPASTAAGLPLADLTIKDAYLDEYAGFSFVNFLIANVGQKDAGKFEVSVKYNYAPGGMVDARWDVYPVDSLKAGESTWVSASPICCGWTPTEQVVKNAVQFEVIADPKYSKADPLDPANPSKSYEVKSRIAESNKGNNKLVINKADMRHGKLSGTVTKPATPAIGTIKLQAPVTKH